MMTEPGASHAANRLLGALPKNELERLDELLAMVPLRTGDLLVDAGHPIRHIYFPHAGVISLVSVLEDGQKAEVATIGAEGAAGLEVLLEGDTPTNRTLAQVSGQTSRLDVGRLREAMDASPSLRPLLLRYLRVFLIQLTQSVACNGLHIVEERCCRWLLMAHDRARRDTFDLKHEFLAEMLGVRRASVSIVARSLQKAGIIRYRRGSITVLDREGLEEGACACYWIVRRAFDEFLPTSAATTKSS